MQTLAEDQEHSYGIPETLAQEIRQNTLNIAELWASIAELRQVSEQQNRAITYLMKRLRIRA